MKQEDKEILLKDLSARLPYNVIINYTEEDDEKTNFDCFLSPDMIKDIKSETAYWIIKPYLRPMSNMTEEEKKDILQSLNIHGDIDNEGNLLLGVECDIITLKVCKKYLGELNKRMFDVCHMIELGLALEAPKGMYNLNK